MEKKLTNEELAVFFRQISMVLSAGLAPAEGIQMLREDSAQSGAAVLDRILDALSEGKGFYESLENGRVFPAYALQLVRIGEEAGRLDQVTNSLADYYERQDALSREIRSALTYPLIMIGILLVILVVLLTKVLPVFNQVYRELGSEMTGISRVLLNAGTLLNRFAFPALLILVLLAVCLGWLTKKRRIRPFFLKKVDMLVAQARFADGVALTLSSGLDMEEGVQMAADLVEEPRLLAKIQHFRDSLSQGEDFSKALSDNEIFSGSGMRLILVGSKTGSMDEAMKKVAARYQEEAGQRVSDLVSLLEPAMVAGLSIIVGIILFSVILPLLGIMTGITTLS